MAPEVILSHINKPVYSLLISLLFSFLFVELSYTIDTNGKDIKLDANGKLIALKYFPGKNYEPSLI